MENNMFRINAVSCWLMLVFFQDLNNVIYFCSWVRLDQVESLDDELELGIEDELEGDKLEEGIEDKRKEGIENELLEGIEEKQEKECLRAIVDGPTDRQTFHVGI
ncbi:hypothetical protein LOTGIDRAFT_160025 [Lottia gigantea]|uniref:Uncharacterized protein n=1 Tax=Lottia gigantea TaxID=225164 RepID=V4AMP6_LOTGI|nr:hypothetical protein LOTGIDRAFT_160025 [Lottia gigantea]ESO96045.1 hypothetical protein LOTGIDRAFT_160025 [Lottia gigantea]